MVLDKRSDHLVLAMQTILEWFTNIINIAIDGHVLVTITVMAPTARPRTFHVDVSTPPATRRYVAKTSIPSTHNTYFGKLYGIPIVLLLLNDNSTDWTANAVGRRNLGFGYA